MAVVYAALPNYGVIGQGLTFGGNTIGDILNGGILNIIFFVAGAAFLIYLVTGGISLMLSRGDPKAISEAKARITYGLVGFLIIVAAYWIVQIVGAILGLEGFKGVFQQ